MQGFKHLKQLGPLIALDHYFPCNCHFAVPVIQFLHSIAPITRTLLQATICYPQFKTFIVASCGKKNSGILTWRAKLWNNCRTPSSFFSILHCLFVPLLGNKRMSRGVSILIGPKSDHCVALSVNDSLLLLRVDWCNSGFWGCELKTVAYVDAEECVWIRFWSGIVVKVSKFKIGQNFEPDFFYWTWS